MHTIRSKKAPPRRDAPAAKEPVAKPKASPAGVVAAVLRQAGWEFEREDEAPWVTFRTAVESGGGVVETYARVSAELSRFALYFVWGTRASPERRGELDELVTRINDGLGDGNFELTLATGEVRLKIAVDFSGVPLPSRLVRNAILDAIELTERYEPALYQVLRGEATAKEAIAAVEE